MVRAGTVRLFLLFRRRRERRRELPAIRRLVWTTDKDGPIMDLLAAEITARTGKDPGEHYRELTAEFGAPIYSGSMRPPLLSRRVSCSVFRRAR